MFSAGEVDEVAAALAADADGGDVERVARRREAAAEDVARHDRRSRRRRWPIRYEAATRNDCVWSWRFSLTSTLIRAPPQLKPLEAKPL